MSELKNVWALELEPYMDYKKVRVYYTKNGTDQNAVFMNFGVEKDNWAIIEEAHIVGNKLSKAEQKELATMLNNKEMFIKELEND